MNAFKLRQISRNKKKEFKSNLVSANFVAEPEVPYEIPGILALKYN